MAEKPKTPTIPTELPEHLKPKKRFGGAILQGRRPVDLESLRDVQKIPGDPNDGDVLTWDDTLKKWVPEAPTTGVTDHGALTGLLDDDHSQYVHNTLARTISANHTLTSFTDISEIAVPANPTAGTRRLFTNTVTGELSVRTSAGTTVSLESGSGTSDHGSLTGLTDDDHPQYLLLAGRTGTTNNAILSTTADGTLAGSAASGGSLLLTSSTHATKDRIMFGTLSAFDEVNTRLGLNVPVPLYQFHSNRTSTATTSDIAHAVLANWAPSADWSSNKWNLYNETTVGGTAVNNGAAFAAFIIADFTGTNASLGTGSLYGGFFSSSIGNSAGGSASRLTGIVGGLFRALDWSTFTGGVAVTNLTGGSFTAACAIDPGAAQTITNMRGGLFTIESTTANHTVTNAIIADLVPTSIGVGTLANSFGLRIRNWPVGPTYSTVSHQLYLDAATISGAHAIRQLGALGQNRFQSNSTFGADTTPTAKVHLAAGTTAASTAPLKFTTGTSMTAEEAGAVEFTTDDLFFTITTGTARKRLLMAEPVGGLTSGRVPFATTNGRLTDDADLTFDGSTLTVLNLTVTGTLSATIDHGSLTGLGDDDHPQYLLADGTRALTGNWDAGSFEIRAETFESDVATGTAPFTVASTTLVTNLNADLLDGQHGAFYLDSDNFTGTEWTDLTDGGDTTLHTHDHGLLGGLTDDDHAQYTLRAGRTGATNDTILSSDANGTLAGSAASGAQLRLTSTTHPTKGHIRLGVTSFYNETAESLGIRVSPSYPLHVVETSTSNAFSERAAYITHTVTPSAPVTNFASNSALTAISEMSGAQTLGAFSSLLGAQVLAGFTSTSASLSGGFLTGVACQALLGFGGTASRLANVTGGLFDTQNYSTFTGGVACTTMTGGIFIARMAGAPGGAQTITNLRGGTFQVTSIASSDHTFTNVEGLRVEVADMNLGTISTMAVGVHILGWDTGPTYTAAPEQLRLASMSIANSIGIRQIGSTPHNRFQGSTKFGADTAPTFLLDAVESFTGTSGTECILSLVQTVQPPSDSTAVVYGLIHGLITDIGTAHDMDTLGFNFSQVRYAGSGGTLGTLVGSDIRVVHGTVSGAGLTSGTVTSLLGTRIEAYENAAGGVNGVIAGIALTGAKRGTGTATDLFGGHITIESTLNGGTTGFGAGTITRATGLKVSGVNLAGSSVIITNTIDDCTMVEIGEWPTTAWGPFYTSPPVQLKLIATTTTDAIGIYQDGTGAYNKYEGRSMLGADSVPTAKAHLGAGTTAASSAPLKFTSGTSMTAAEEGAVEFTTDDLFFTIATGTARKRLLMADPTGGLTSGRVPFATTNGRLTDDSDMTFAGSTLTITQISNGSGGIASSGQIKSSSASAGVGYATGAGATVTQITSKATGVTINTVCGQITMDGGALANNAEVSFVVTNSQVAAADVIIVNIKSGGTVGSYNIHVSAVAAGSFTISLGNVSGGSLSQAVVLSFAVIKAVTS